jgi:hypothetical protein
LIALDIHHEKGMTPMRSFGMTAAALAATYLVPVAAHSYLAGGETPATQVVAEGKAAPVRRLELSSYRLNAATAGEPPAPR